MNLPFNIQQFLQLFKDYNQAVFPLQFLFYLLAIAIIYLSINKNAWSDKTANLIFSFFWLWMGIVYHLLFFSKINYAAYYFSGLFVIQGVLFLVFGVLKKSLAYQFKPSISGWIGSVLIIFALVVYPLLGYFVGHSYPRSPSFGLPCPTTIFTFGIMLWSEKKIPMVILAIPMLWSAIGFSAALRLGMKEDISLLIAALLTIAVIVSQKKHQPEHC